MRRVGGAELSLKVNDIFSTFCAVIVNVLEEHCYCSVFASLAFARLLLVSRRSKPAFPAIVFINEVLTPIALALNQHLLESLL